MDRFLVHFQLVWFAIGLLVFACLAIFFSFAETSLMAVNRYRLRYEARLKKRYALMALHLLKRPDRVLSVILIGSTFANMLLSSMTTLLAEHFWGEQGALIAVVAIAILILVFGEVIPKTLSVLYPEKVVRYITFPIQLFVWLLYPLAWLANLATRYFLKLFHISVTVKEARDALSRDELRSIVYDTSHQIPKRYQQMLLSVLDLNKLTVDDAMITKSEMPSINLEETWEHILKQLHQSTAEAIPCYRGSVNHIVGVLWMQDMWRALLKATTFNKQALESMLRQPYFVPSGTSLATQLAAFQKGTKKIAFIVDEYGDLLGTLTINDILEEIVGDLAVNLNQRRRIVEQTDESYLVQGMVTIRELNRTLQLTLPTGGAKTLSGLIIDHLGALPHAGVSVLIARYPIEIVTVKDNRVMLAKIGKKLPPTE